MATNYRKSGEVTTFTAPSGGVVSGTPVLIGSLLVVPLFSAAEDAEFEGKAVGEWTLPKTSAQAWTEGQKIYWNVGTDLADSDGTTGPLIGVAVAVAANPSGTGVVRLNGAAPAASEGPQAAIASLTFGTNITAATADGTLTDSSATNPSDAQFNELAKELGTKVNDILVALRAAGIIAT